MRREAVPVTGARKRSRWRVTLILVLAAFTIGLVVWIVTTTPSEGLDPTAISGLLVSLVALSLGVVSFLREANDRAVRSAAEYADDLADVLLQEWRGEVEAIGSG